MNAKVLDIIAEYLDECEVEEFVDEDFGKGAARDIVDRLESAGFFIVQKPAT